MDFMSNAVLGMAGWDWLIVGLYFAVTLSIGLSVSKKAGKDEASFFLGGRSQPWWLLGFSMVATTFSTDTPNLVADIVRTQGVAGNWVWWAFLLTGMLTVFIYAKLWRRSGILTDLEFYELRYSGKWASFLRGFRAVYLGFLFNIVIMATVTMAAIKIGGVVLGLAPWQVILFASIVTLLVSGISGFQGVLLTDFLLFILAMTGAVAAAIFAIRGNISPIAMAEFGGDNADIVKEITSNLQGVNGLKDIVNHENVKGLTNIFPSTANWTDFLTILIIPIAVQWWAAYYPGAEPGGGGYLVQKMLAAKDEKNSVGATLFFNVCHYALRPWPWILVALASLIVFPKDNVDEVNKANMLLHHKKNAAVVMIIEKEAETGSIELDDFSVFNFKGSKFKNDFAENNFLQSEKAIFDSLVAEFGKDINVLKKYHDLAILCSTNPSNADLKKLTILSRDYVVTDDERAMLRQIVLKAKGTSAIGRAFPKTDFNIIGHDIAYPAMLKTFLPIGIMGIMMASLLAAYMSTIGTHLNWGSSYMANDIWKRFIRPTASAKELVWIGRLSTLILLLLSAGLALMLDNAKQAFDIILMMGAGTGLMLIMRWFWWRMNALSEFTGMVVSFAIAMLLKLILKNEDGPLVPAEYHLIINVVVTTIAWVSVTFMTKPVDNEVLRSFVTKMNPGGPGWKKVFKQAEAEGNPIKVAAEPTKIAKGILLMVLGSTSVYCALFATGQFIFGRYAWASALTVVCVITTSALLWLIIKKPDTEEIK